MPAVLEHERRDLGSGRAGVLAPTPRVDERRVRDDLRAQIARLELRLGEVFASAFPRQGIEWRVGAVGGPRVLDVAELERVRDALAFRLREAQTEIARRADVEEANRGVLESMIAEPERYRWVRVSNEDIGERGCRHWHSRPRWGVLGMLLSWWRVKVSSGCPLARVLPGVSAAAFGGCEPSSAIVLGRSRAVSTRRSLRPRLNWFSLANPRRHPPRAAPGGP